MQIKRLLVPFLGALVLFFSASPVVSAREGLDEQEMELIRLREEIKRESGFGWKEIGAISWELREFLSRSSESDEARSMVRASLSNGCRGECLSETLRAMNIALEEGVEAEDARKMVTRALVEHKALKGRARGAKVVESVERELGAQ